MATAETVMAVYSDISIGIALDGVRGQGTGKPDETERLMSGLERGRRKSTERQLADVLLYRTPGSEGEVPGNRHLYPTSRPWTDASASRQSHSGSRIAPRNGGVKSAVCPASRQRLKFATGPVTSAQV
jgi:hypothetical protein